MFSRGNNQEEEINNVGLFFRPERASLDNNSMVDPNAVSINDVNVYRSHVAKMGPEKAQEYFWQLSEKFRNMHGLPNRFSPPSTVLSEEEFLKFLNIKLLAIENATNKKPKGGEQAANYPALRDSVEILQYTHNDVNLYRSLIPTLGPEKTQEILWIQSQELRNRLGFTCQYLTCNTLLSEKEFLKLLAGTYAEMGNHLKSNSKEQQPLAHSKYSELVARYNNLANLVAYLNTDDDSTHTRENSSNKKINFRP